MPDAPIPPSRYHLTSPRLGFRTWLPADLPLAHNLWTHPGVMRYMGGVMTSEGVHQRLALEIHRQQQFGFCYWPIELLKDHSFAGVCGLRPYLDSTRTLELGVHIHPRLWSLRLGEEAATTIIHHAFRTLGATQLIAGHGPGHTNSQHLIQRLGFTFSHQAPWGDQGILHPFYTLPNPASPTAL